MRALLLVLLTIAFALLFAEFAPDHSFIRIAVGKHIIESNLWLMLALVVLVVAVLWLLTQVAKALLSNENPLKFWSRKAKQKRAINRTKKGVIALVEGDWQQATRLLSQAAPHVDTKLLNYLGAARAAGESGNDKEAANLIQKAVESAPDAAFAIGLTQAQVQLAQQQLEPCLATLIRLKNEQPQHKLVLKLLKVVYLKFEDWQQLSQLLPDLKKHKVFPEDQLNQLEHQVWQERLRRLGDAPVQAVADARQSAKLAEFWSQVPNSLRENEDFIYQYTLTLEQLGDGVQAETLLKKLLHRQWSDRLIELYGRVNGRDANEQLISAESWLKQRPNNASLLLTLGRLCLRNEAWGKALEYFEASHAQKPSQASYAELCRLAPLLKTDLSKQRDWLVGLLETLELPALPKPK